MVKAWARWIWVLPRRAQMSHLVHWEGTDLTSQFLPRYTNQSDLVSLRGHQTAKAIRQESISTTNSFMPILTLPPSGYPTCSNYPHLLQISRCHCPVSWGSRLESHASRVGNGELHIFVQLSRRSVQACPPLWLIANPLHLSHWQTRCSRLFLSRTKQWGSCVWLMGGLDDALRPFRPFFHPTTIMVDCGIQVEFGDILSPSTIAT